MNINTLKNAWHTSTVAPVELADIDRMTREVRDATRHVERGARWRVIFGSVAFGLTVTMLVVLALLPQVWLGMRMALVLWASSLTACIFRLWRIRGARRLPSDMPLTAHLQSCLERVRREIAYHRSLRWWFWLPFGVGFLMAIAQRLPATPDIRWLAPVAVAVFCGWGFNQGPRVWPRRLQPEIERLQGLLDRASDPVS